MNDVIGYVLVSSEEQAVGRAMLAQHAQFVTEPKARRIDGLIPRLGQQQARRR